MKSIQTLQELLFEHGSRFALHNHLEGLRNHRVNHATFTGKCESSTSEILYQAIDCDKY